MIDSWLKSNDVEKDLIAHRFDLLLFCTGSSRRVQKRRSLPLIASLLSQLIKIIRFSDFTLGVHEHFGFEQGIQKRDEN